MFAVTAALLGVAGCGNGPGSCVSGALCECSDGTDCYQGCADGHGCDLLCHTWFTAAACAATAAVSNATT
jgi:hypothetical protein